MFRNFSQEDLDAVRAFLKNEDPIWEGNSNHLLSFKYHFNVDKLSRAELEELEETKYFKEIYQNGIRLAFYNFLNLCIKFCFRESTSGDFCDITCQVDGQDDIPDKIFEILSCFDQFPIMCQVDFFFFCHSKARLVFLILNDYIRIFHNFMNQLRAYDLIYPSRNTSYDTDIRYLKDFSDVDKFVDNFKNLNAESILNKHISSRMNSEWNQSGLAMGRIFAVKLYLSSHSVNYRQK